MIAPRRLRRDRRRARLRPRPRQGRLTGGPVPPEAEALRAARDRIDPHQVFHLTLPGGGVDVVSGEELLALASAFADLAAADSAGDERALRAAVFRLMSLG